eukprot:COSAG04_NODE_1302_length_7312_cov_2.782289_6_plen_205_part_00
MQPVRPPRLIEVAELFETVKVCKENACRLAREIFESEPSLTMEEAFRKHKDKLGGFIYVRKNTNHILATPGASTSIPIGDQNAVRIPHHVAGLPFDAIITMMKPPGTSPMSVGLTKRKAAFLVLTFNNYRYLMDYARDAMELGLRCGVIGSLETKLEFADAFLECIKKFMPQFKCLLDPAADISYTAPDGSGESSFCHFRMVLF